MTASAALCEVDGCGVLAVGRCWECRRAFCASHQARGISDARFDEQGGRVVYRYGGLGVGYPDDKVEDVARRGGEPLADRCSACYLGMWHKQAERRERPNPSPESSEGREGAARTPDEAVVNALLDVEDPSEQLLRAVGAFVRMESSRSEAPSAVAARFGGHVSVYAVARETRFDLLERVVPPLEGGSVRGARSDAVATWFAAMANECGLPTEAIPLRESALGAKLRAMISTEAGSRGRGWSVWDFNASSSDTAAWIHAHGSRHRLPASGLTWVHLWQMSGRLRLNSLESALRPLPFNS